MCVCVPLCVCVCVCVCVTSTSLHENKALQERFNFCFSRDFREY